MAYKKLIKINLKTNEDRRIREVRVIIVVVFCMREARGIVMRRVFRGV